MTTWIPCTSRPRAGNVIRWTEPLWAPPTQKRGLRDKLGEQRLVARVVAFQDYADLEVITVEKMAGPEEVPLSVKAGDRIKRKESSLAQGDCHYRAED